MFGNFAVSLTFLGAGLLSLLANPASASPVRIMPAAGKYRIQNVATGLFLDALNANQGMHFFNCQFNSQILKRIQILADGTPVVVAPLNDPPTVNQEWTLAVNGANIGTLQSTNSFIRVLNHPSQTNRLVTKLGTKEQGFFTLVETSGGVFICATPSSFGCLTSPTEANSTLTFEPFTGAETQIFAFRPVI